VTQPNNEKRSTASNQDNRTEAAKQQADKLAGTGKQEAAAVKDTAAQQAGQVKDTVAAEAQQVKQTAADQAQALKETTVEAAAELGGTAKAEAQQVATEAVDQIRTLVDTTRTEVRSRAADGQQALTGTLAGLTDELGRITRGETTNGPVAQFAGELASRGENLTRWLQGHEPEDVLVEVRRFAARRPVAFLALAAGAGMLAGRVARGTREITRDESQPHRIAGQDPLTYPTDYVPTGQYATGQYNGGQYAPTGQYATTGQQVAQPRRGHETGYPANYTPQPGTGHAGEFTPEGTRVTEGYVHTTTEVPGQTQGRPDNGGAAR